ncbi:hypothetical protein E6H27_02235 [Candidatus Bathyarchaeota archaeon]|nr:MAG: hypothetical protein E6H27_02235 [Candidatus Bathyarchaeota archaeon]
MTLSKDSVGKAVKNLSTRSEDKHLSFVPPQVAVLMAKHGLDKGSIFKPLDQLRNIGSAMSGKMYVCKCGMIFDSADKFNEHMNEVQRR